MHPLEIFLRRLHHTLAHTFVAYRLSVETVRIVAAMKAVGR